MLKHSVLAPVCLFVYARPIHTRRVLRALARSELAEKAEVIIYSDGPRDERFEGPVREVRNMLRNIKGFRHIELVTRDRNLGLSASIIGGVTEVCQTHGRVIVLEDDVVVSRYFLRYMNDSLLRYADDRRISSIGGYMYPIANRLPDQFFLSMTDCWGWATWQRAWNEFNQDGSVLLKEIESKGLVKRFNLDGAYDYRRMLQAQIAGKNDSWAVRWYANEFLKNRLTLFPGRSMTINIGNDGSGRHKGNNRLYGVLTANERLVLRDIPVEECALARRAINEYLIERQRSVFWRFKEWIIGSLRRRLYETGIA